MHGAFFIKGYLAEIFHHLFLHTDRYDWVNKHCNLGGTIEGRDEVSIKKSIYAMLKLLYPAGEPAAEELDQYIEYALEGRRGVKEHGRRFSDHLEGAFAQCG